MDNSRLDMLEYKVQELNRQAVILESNLNGLWGDLHYGSISVKLVADSSNNLILDLTLLDNSGRSMANGSTMINVEELVFNGVGNIVSKLDNILTKLQDLDKKYLNNAMHEELLSMVEDIKSLQD